MPEAEPGGPIGYNSPPGGPIQSAETLPVPEGRAISPLFNIGGAPIAVLGGVFSDGLPIGGPVTQVFRGGSAPTPPTLFISTLTPSGPIGSLLIGEAGAPIGVLSIGGGGLPVGIPPEEGREVSVIQPRTTLVGASEPLIGLTTPPVLFFGSDAGSGGGGGGIGLNGSGGGSDGGGTGSAGGGVGSGGAPIGG